MERGEPTYFRESNVLGFAGFNYGRFYKKPNLPASKPLDSIQQNSPSSRCRGFWGIWGSRFRLPPGLRATSYPKTCLTA